MKFVQAWSYSCAKFLASQQNENHEKRRVYYYGLQAIVGAVVKGIMLTGITLILGSFLPTLLVVVSFASLRTSAGGYHMKTYGKCVAASLGLFILAGVIVQYTQQYWSNTYLVAFLVTSLIACILALVRWAPSDNPNRPITGLQQIRKFKRASIICVFLWAAVMPVMMFLELHPYAISVCFGLLLEVFTVTPIGHKFFDKISGK